MSGNETDRSDKMSQILKLLDGQDSLHTQTVHHAENLFLENFETWCDEIVEMAGNNVITGDFNINWSKKYGASDKLKNIINYLGLKQKVLNFTRVTN